MDESQLAIPFEYFKPSYFNTEEEAFEYKKEHKLHTNPHYSEKLDKWYICNNNLISDTIKQSIDEAAQYLNIAVELGIEWEIEKSWYGCH